MQRAVDDALSEVDAALVLLNAAEPIGAGDRFILRAVAGADRPAIHLLNKCDAVSADRVERRLAEARELTGGADVLAVSALRRKGLAPVVERLAAAMPAGPAYFPEGHLTDQPLELLIAELVREQALRRTRDEVPHAVAVEVTEMVEREDRPLVEIQAQLIVETESQKAILVGKGGQTVKAIGSAARHEIESVVGAQVFLDLRVKVRRRWRRDERYVERLL
jgi:GTP-binding protein Era